MRFRSSLSRFTRAAVLAALLVDPAAAQAPTFVREWGAFGTGNGQFQYPMGLAIDGSGRLYVADWFNCRVQVFTGDGNFVSAWGSYGNAPGEFSGPLGLAFDSGGNLYVTDASSRSPLVNNRVQAFGSGAAFLFAWGVPGSWGVPPGKAPGTFDSPEGVAIDASGRVYVADTFNARIQVFTSTGAPIGAWDGAGGGGMAYPRGVALDASGKLYVADDGSSTVHVFDGSGSQIANWSAGETPWGVAVRGNEVYVVEAGSNRVEVFTTSGTPIMHWGERGTGPGQFMNPMGIALDGAGGIYVSDQGNHRIQKFAQLPTVATKTTWSRLKSLYR